MPYAYKGRTNIAEIDQLMRTSRTTTVSFAAIERFRTVEEIREFFPHYVRYLRAMLGNFSSTNPIRSAMANFRYVIREFYDDEKLRLWELAFSEISETHRRDIGIAQGSAVPLRKGP